MKNQDILKLFKDTNALLKGHFLLSSGLHSAQYLQCALVLQHPEYAQKLGTLIAENFKGKGINCVAGPALGGIVIAHEVASALGVRCVFGERENGSMTLRRGFVLGKNDKVLVVEDVITTGGSIKELIKVVKGSGASVVGVGAVVDRSSQRIDFGCSANALVKLDVKTYKPEECPLCKEGSAPVKPGSRK